MPAIRQIGILARQTLASSPTAKVIGVTSRGIFLLTPDQQIIFLSREHYASPLTANLDDPACSLPLENGDPATLSPQVITFPTHTLSLSILPASTDLPSPSPLPPATIGNNEEILSRLAQCLHLVSVSDDILTSNPANITSSLLGQYYFFPPSSFLLSPFSFLLSLLGLGSGLTPSGDDLICGYLLALTRWQSVLTPAFDLPQLAAKLISAAQTRTTSISANLIAAAAQGLADERLITALDGILTGIPDAETCAQCLLAYGNSSGKDALAGFELAIAGTLDR